MKPLDSRSLQLWRALIRRVLDPKAHYGDIVNAAKRAGKAQVPAGHEKDRNSPFMRIYRVGCALRAGDEVSRQLLVDYAHACRKVLEGAMPPVHRPIVRSVPVRRRADIDD